MYFKNLNKDNKEIEYYLDIENNKLYNLTFLKVDIISDLQKRSLQNYFSMGYYKLNHQDIN